MTKIQVKLIIQLIKERRSLGFVQCVCIDIEALYKLFELSNAGGF